MSKSPAVIRQTWPPAACPTIGVGDWLKLPGRTTIDVRSPREFARGHIAGAINIPLFNDAQRAEVGTIYKQVGSPAAIQRGLEIATAQAGDLLCQVRTQLKITAQAEPSEFAVHCWRGGMRSQGFAGLCHDNGLQPLVIEGGYKAFRRLAHAAFLAPFSFIVLTGSTGCGKTDLLKRLAAAGEQIIDLEGLAHHRGSVFGGIGQAAQPTVEQFENKMFLTLRELDPQRPIWLEDESRSIGRCYIPEAFWHQMSAAPAIVVDQDVETRIERLGQEYGQLPKDALCEAIRRLKKRLGGKRLQAALEHVEAGQMLAAAGIVLEYYDKSYGKALAARPGTLYHNFHLPPVVHDCHIQSLRDLGHSLATRKGSIE